MKRAILSAAGSLAAFGVLSALAPALHAQQKPALQSEDYDRWETLGRPALHPFARFVAHSVYRVDEKSELRIRRLRPDTTLTIPWGQGAEFSADGRWLAWEVGVSPDEREQLERSEEPVRTVVWVLDLEGGLEPVEVGIGSDAHFDATGRFLVVQGYPPSEPEGAGAAIRVLDLVAGSEVGFSNVDEMVWAPRGSWLAMTLATGEDEGNGVQLYDAASGVMRGLDASGSAYSGLGWREDATDLVVLRTVGTASADENAVDVLAWRGVEDNPSPRVLTARADLFADTLEVVRHRTPIWSEDGRRITVGLRPHDDSEDESGGGASDDTTDTGGDSENDSGDPDAESDESAVADDQEAEDPATVQIWHTSDVDIIPAQQVRAGAAERATLLASWDLDADRVTQVGFDLAQRANISGGLGVERRSDPYPWGAKFGRPYHDLWTVDLESGARVRTLERVRYSWVSPTGEHVLWFDGEDYRTLNVARGDTVNLTADIETDFANTSWDTPTDGVLPPRGMGGWLADDEAVLLYDQFDVWRIAPDGTSAERLTQGRADAVVHRMQNLHPDRDAYAADEPLMFSLRGEWTEDRGFARASASRYERLVLEPKSFWWLQRADSVEKVIYRTESRVDAPDLYLADLDLSDAQLVTESNPFMADYAWTRTELVEYVNADGVRLHGSLLYPVNYDASQKYPMIVYAYELLTPQLHFWDAPSERDYYNTTAWTQQGYFVLLPDIVFRARDPGVSTAEALDGALRVIDERGLIDRERVGFIGHSWGGYEAAYLAARTELFTTTVSGAPLTDFVSFMGSIHWNPGLPEVDHWENGQARMAVPYWEDPDAHERNSPIHGVHTMTTPILMAHGDDDGVVEFFQATEFYNFARRAEKEMVLLVYEGEDHGFRQKANQVDYHRRILEWFGHYLKGEPAPEWITQGVRWADHEEERARVAKGGGG